MTFVKCGLSALKYPLLTAAPLNQTPFKKKVFYGRAIFFPCKNCRYPVIKTSLTNLWWNSCHRLTPISSYLRTAWGHRSIFLMSFVVRRVKNIINCRGFLWFNVQSAAKRRWGIGVTTFFNVAPAFVFTQQGAWSIWQQEGDVSLLPSIYN